MNESSDRIEREILLQVPRARVWRALTTPEEFGRWFRVNVDGQRFAPGVRVLGTVAYPGWEHIPFEILVERMEPERVFAWRWHPAAIEPDVDYSQEPMTHVIFDLSDAAGGTLLRVVESGFDAIPPHRRLTVFRMNTEGWAEQMNNISDYVGVA